MTVAFCPTDFSSKGALVQVISKKYLCSDATQYRYYSPSRHYFLDIKK
jgi:hypothetical protein